MTQNEIDIIVDDDDIWDMLHYVYCLRRVPDQFANVASTASEIRQVKRVILDEIKKHKNKFV